MSVYRPIDNNNKHLITAFIALQEGNLFIAEKILSQLHKSMPNNKEVIYLYTDTLFRAGKIDDVIELFKGLDDKVSYYEFFKNLGLNLINQGFYHEALRIFLECYKQIPEINESLFFIGLCYHHMKIYEEAYKFLTAYVYNGGSNKKAFFLLADICRSVKKDVSSAYIYLHKSIGISPEQDLLIYHFLAMTSFTLGKYEECIDLFNKSSELRDKQFERCFTLGIAYFILGKHEEARKAFEELLKCSKFYTPARFFLYHIKEKDGINKLKIFMNSKASNPSISNSYSDVIKHHSSELAFVFDKRDRYWQSSNFLNDLDGIILYTLIRQLKPKNCIEFSPFRGYSTVFQYKALERNGGDFTFATFDLAETSEFSDLMRLFSIPLNVITGDAIEEVPRYITDNKLVGQIDFCLVDSDHGFEFAKAYTEKIFPLLGENCIIAIHDLYYKPESIDLPFDHYRPIKYTEICENPASVGEARAVIKFFRKNDNYVLFSTHKLFGGVSHCAHPLPLNSELLTNTGTDLHFLEAGMNWTQSPMLIIAIPKTIYNQKRCLFNIS